MERRSYESWGRIYVLVGVAIFIATATSQANTRLKEGLEGLRFGSRIDSAALIGHIRTLSTSYPSRNFGSPGDSAAAEYVAAQFRRSGLQSVQFQSFETPIPKDRLSRVIVPSQGDTLNLHAFPPNFARTNTVIPAGIRGELIYGGQGHPRELNGREVDGAIILYEMDIGRRWTMAPALGAKGAIFIEPEDPYASGIYKAFRTSINFPRFWVDRAEGERLKAVAAEHLEVIVQAHQPWERTSGRNVIGFLEGTDPVLSREVVVLAAGFDGISILDSRGQGAEQTGGISALLEVARLFGEQPPLRSVMFVGLDGSSGFRTALVGPRTLIHALSRNFPVALGQLVRQFREDLRLISDRKVAGKFEEYRALTLDLQDRLDLLVSDQVDAASDSWNSLVEAKTDYKEDAGATKDRQGSELEEARRELGQEIGQAAGEFLPAFRAAVDALVPLIDEFDQLRSQYLVYLRGDIDELQPIVDADQDKIRTDLKGRLAAARLTDVKRAMKKVRVIAGDDYRRRITALMGQLDLAAPVVERHLALFTSLNLTSHQDGLGIFYKGNFFNQVPDLALKRAFGGLGKRFNEYAENVTISANLDRLWRLSDQEIQSVLSAQREEVALLRAQYNRLVDIQDSRTAQADVWYHNAFNNIMLPTGLVLLLFGALSFWRAKKAEEGLPPKWIAGAGLGLIMVLLWGMGYRWHGTTTVDYAIDTLIRDHGELLLDAKELPRDNKSKIRVAMERNRSYLDVVQTPRYFADNVRHAIRKTISVLGQSIDDADKELARLPEQLKLRGAPVTALTDSQLIKLRELIIKLEVGEPRRFVDGVAGTKGKAWYHYLPGRSAFPSEVATMSGIPGITLATTDDSSPLGATPFDSFENLELGNLYRQTRAVAALLSQAVNDTTLPDDFILANNSAEIWGQTLIEDRTGGTLAGVAIDSVLVIANRGFRKFVAMSDKRGQFHIYGMGLDGRVGSMSADYWIYTYKMSQDSGHIHHALDVGSELYAFKPTMGQRSQKMSFVLFPSASISVTDLVDQRYFTFLPKGDVFDARTDATPRNYSVHSTGSGGMSFFTNEGLKVKFTFAQGLLGIRMVMTNVPDEITDDKDREGVGFTVQAETLITHSAMRAARDMWYLDEGRLQSLIRHGIIDEDTRALHDSSRAHLDRAKAHLEEYRYDEYLSEARTALALESSVMPQILDTANGTLKGVLFYMSLLLPFAFFAERLFIGSVDVRKQALGFFGLFVVMFLLIQWIHPAFDIVSAPAMILVAFTVFTLSAFVGGIIISKFSAQMREMRRNQGIMQADVGRVSAMSAAFMLGVSNMRKRKVRTALTCVTLILLTFTVLSFTSVTEYLRVNKISLSKEKAIYPGLLIRDRNWIGWPREMLEALQNELGEKYTVTGRAWREAFQFGADFFFSLEGPTGIEATISGMVGMEPQEAQVTGIDKALVAGRWFVDGDTRAIVIPQSLAATLEIDEEQLRSGDEGTRPSVRFEGTPYSVVGILSDEALRDMKDLDGEGLTSVNWQVADQTRKTSRDLGSTRDISQVGSGDSYVHLAPGQCVFLPLNQVHGDVISIAVKVNSSSEAIPLIESVIPKWALEIYVGDDAGTYLYSAVGLTALGGLGDVLIPIVIAALIVLNTMMGAVYERTREIGIFSAVGLAPSHIAMLFMAEACVYAVLGAISGYMLGQFVGQIVANSGILGGVTLNYSSVSAVVSTSIVMLTVLLSTIYPAVRASQVSVPDIARTWKLPEPDGDEWYFPLPFTLMDEELEGVNSFLSTYFEAHHEESSSDFYIDQVDFWAEDGKFMLETMVWLSPYDLGVSELVTVITSPVPDEKGLFAMSLLVTRVSGDVPSWTRVNRRFVNFLRKQFLMWRTLTTDERIQFVARGRETFGAWSETPQVEIDSESSLTPSA